MKGSIPVVIDCDPGIDDAHALLMALASKKLDVLAVTTVAGNMPLAVTTRNALSVIQLAGFEVPVARGCEEALFQSKVTHSDVFHGKNGLGNAEIAESDTEAVSEHAVERIRKVLASNEKKVHIIALGPLTNIALLLKMYPDIKHKIDCLTIMGGAKSGGNITEAAEFNFYSDAQSASIVMNSDIPITLIDLEGCESANLTFEEANEILRISSRVTGFLSDMWKFNIELAKRFNAGGFVIHDSIAVASVIESNLVRTKKCNVRIETNSNDQYGRCFVDWNSKGNVRISMQTNKERFIQLCEETLRYYSF